MFLTCWDLNKYGYSVKLWNYNRTQSESVLLEIIHRNWSMNSTNGVKHIITSLLDCIYLFIEGPRSRCYGRTAALKAYCATLWWRWSFFFCFSILMEHRWNEIDRGKPKYSERNQSQCHFVHHKSHMDRPQDRTRDSAVRGRRLTARAMAQPLLDCMKDCVTIV
jgi:hypothetical protein